MSTLSAPAPAKAHPARQKAIQPYLDKLHAWCNSAAGSQDLEHAAKVTLGSQQLVLEPWERAQLMRFFAGSLENVPALLAHGVAIVIKSTLDVERLKKAKANASVESYALQAELMLDTAIGMALLKETELVTAAEVQDGNVDTAKSLSVFRHKLSRGVAQARTNIAESEQRQAEALADSLIAGQFARQVAAGRATAGDREPAAPRLIEEEEPLPIGHTPSRRRRPGPPKTVGHRQPIKSVQIPGRFTLLAVTVCVLATVWLAFVQVPSMLRKDLQPIHAAQLGDHPGLTVDSRPPSLFVTLPETQWVSMDSTEQDALIDSISSVATLKGYTGAVVTTDTGKPVARWLRERGGERIPLVEQETTTP